MNRFVAILNHPEAAMLAHSLLLFHKEPGELIRVVISRDGKLKSVNEDWESKEMTGNCAIACISRQKGEPFTSIGRYGSFALCTTGQIGNLHQVRNRLRFPVTQTDSSAELLAHAIMQSGQNNFHLGLREVFGSLEGDMALVAMNESGLYLGSCGNESMYIGKIHSKQGALLAASDIRSFLSVATIEREVKLGHLMFLGVQAELFVH